MSGVLRRGADRIVAIGSLAVIAVLVANIWLADSSMVMILAGLAGVTWGLGLGVRLIVDRLTKKQ
jgi:hypothetical protein